MHKAVQNSVFVKFVNSAIPGDLPCRICDRFEAIVVKRRGQKPIYTLGLIATLSILLVILAVLQYDWVGQNAEHERQTLHTALHNLAIDFAERFNREIHKVYSYAEIGG